MTGFFKLMQSLGRVLILASGVVASVPLALTQNGVNANERTLRVRPRQSQLLFEVCLAFHVVVKHSVHVEQLKR